MKTYQGHIVDAVRREIFDGELVVDDGRIVQVNRCELPGDEKQWPYLMPGFIDSHVHDEGSLHHDGLPLSARHPGTEDHRQAPLGQ